MTKEQIDPSSTFASFGRSYQEKVLQAMMQDTLFADQPVSFMKIDVEKMEMKVLAGLRETIARHRPAIFIEIDVVNTEAFEAFRDEIGYRTELTHQRYPWSVNYLILPA